MYFTVGFLGLFVIGGVTGVFLATSGLDIHMHDTYFVVAHFHYIMVGGEIMAFLGGLHFWWPKITGRLYPEFWGKLSASLVFVGFNLTFFPQFIVGYLGMPRRYHTYPPEFQLFNVMSTAGATILGVGYILPFVYFLWSLKSGKVAGPNPWRAKGLEWENTTSPPPTENFASTPIVTEEAYEYSHLPEANVVRASTH
jgi:cytochrome c oxidase subunit 1